MQESVESTRISLKYGRVKANLLQQEAYSEALATLVVLALEGACGGTYDGKDNTLASISRRISGHHSGEGKVVRTQGKSLPLGLGQEHRDGNQKAHF